MASDPVTPFSSRDAVVCRGTRKTWAEGTPRAHEALRDIDLDVPPGEFVVLLGPSGCGKSTLLYLIAGLEESSGGEIVSFGDPVEKPSPDRSLIFQETSLFSLALRLAERQLRPLDPRRAAREASGRGEAGAAARRPRRSHAQAPRRALPAACVSASPWPVHWPCGPRCC